MATAASSRSERMMSITLTLCALVIAFLYARKELFPESGPATLDPGKGRAHEFVDDWKERTSIGVRMGPPGAPVAIAIFSDFECPACRGFFQTVQDARRAHPEGIQLTYIHYPLSYHRFAEPAARASECANAQGRFEAIHDGFFEKQDSLGLKPWRSFAEEAGVADLERFDACVSERGPIPGVEAGKAFGDDIDVRGTPTVLINGWRLSSVPSLKALEEHIAAIRVGKPPISRGN